MPVAGELEVRTPGVVGLVPGFICLDLARRQLEQGVLRKSCMVWSSMGAPPREPVCWMSLHVSFGREFAVYVCFGGGANVGWIM